MNHFLVSMLNFRGCNSILYLYTIYLEPVRPLFLDFNPPKQGFLQSKQGSFGFQVMICLNSISWNLKLNSSRNFGCLPDLPTWKNGGNSVLLSCFMLFFLSFKLLHLLLLFPTKKRGDVLPLPEATCWHQRRWWDRHCWWNPYRPFGDDGQMTVIFGAGDEENTLPVPGGPFASYKAGVINSTYTGYTVTPPVTHFWGHL